MAEPRGSQHKTHEIPDPLASPAASTVSDAYSDTPEAFRPDIQGSSQLSLTLWADNEFRVLLQALLIKADRGSYQQDRGDTPMRPRSCSIGCSVFIRSSVIWGINTSNLGATDDCIGIRTRLRCGPGGVPAAAPKGTERPQQLMALGTPRSYRYSRFTDKGRCHHALKSWTLIGFTGPCSTDPAKTRDVICRLHHYTHKETSSTGHGSLAL